MAFPCPILIPINLYHSSPKLLATIQSSWNTQPHMWQQIEAQRTSWGQGCSYFVVKPLIPEYFHSTLAYSVPLRSVLDTHTPLPSEFSFKPNEKQCDPKFLQKYQQLVGSLMYLMIGSRPDIGFAVVKLAQQMANPSNNHYRVGLHLCRYLLATHRYRLVYNGLSNESLVAYSDSDWGQDHEHCKSTTGYFTMLAQGITSWLSCKQKLVALSSTEAEYMALSVRG